MTAGHRVGRAHGSSAGGGSRARGNVDNGSGCTGGGIFLVRFLPFDFNWSVPWVLQSRFDCRLSLEFQCEFMPEVALVV